MDHQKLLRILAPPAIPRGPGSPAAWRDVEMRLSLPLPGDYKWFIDTYGTGAIDEFILIYNPFSRNQGMNLLHNYSWILEGFQKVIDLGEEIPYPLFPARGGILPFGSSYNGDYICWVTHPLRPWTLWVGSHRNPGHESFELGLVDWLIGILSMDVKSKEFPKDFPSEHPRFKVL